MLKNTICIFIMLLFLTLPKSVSAQVVINEVSSASEPEWVEIYNTSQTEVSLSEYVINFGSDSQNKVFCSNDKIAPSSIRFVVLSSNWLSNTGDSVTLKKGDDIVDSIGYGTGYSLEKPTSVNSISRSPDGSSNWILSSTSSQQGEIVSFECPTSTPSPSPTSEPTTSPTKSPSPTASPTLKPSPTKSPSPKPTASPTAESEETDEPNSGLVLGDVTVSTSSPEAKVKGVSTTNKKSIIAFLFIFTGVLFLGYGGYLLYNMNIKNNDKGNKFTENKDIQDS